MNILITGNSGYVGSHLCQILSKQSNLKIYGMDKIDEQLQIYQHFVQDISESDTTWESSQIEYDCVIHLAAEVAVGKSVKEPTKYFLTNTLGTLNCLSKLKFKNFVFASTGAAAGLESPYGISKRMAEDIVKEYCLSNNVPFTIFRFYNVIGSDGFAPTNPDGLFAKLIEAKTTGIFEIFGTDYNTIDGTCMRDYTHVNEICYAIEKSLFLSSNKIENLGHGIGTSVKQIVEIFKKVNHCNFSVEYKDRRPGDLESSVLDNPSPYMKKIFSIEDLLRYDI